MSADLSFYVKNVYLSEASMQYTLPLSSTIHDLKVAIQALMIGNPEVADQRLIYCGKVCDNAQTLAEVTSMVRFGMLLVAEQYIHVNKSTKLSVILF
jgi:hypothetical protein